MDATGPKHLVLKITRAKFESLVEIRSSAHRAVPHGAERRRPEASDIDDVILVGGKAACPRCTASKNSFGKEPRRDVNPTKPWRGAAIQGAVLGAATARTCCCWTSPRCRHRNPGRHMTKLIQKNTTIPTKASQVFSTADDNQNAVTIHVPQGEREKASANRAWASSTVGHPVIPRAACRKSKSPLTSTPTASRNVSAKDKATGKENKITIQASPLSGSRKSSAWCKTPS